VRAPGVVQGAEVIMVGTESWVGRKGRKGEERAQVMALADCLVGDVHLQSLILALDIYLVSGVMEALC
jgi:hypothetical protein